jgi:protocatechuate 3,4-dioxygenase alpha subunit
MSSARTPSQTVGPFFGFALPWADGPAAVPAGTAGAVRIAGRVLDGRGDPVPDALIETWQVAPAAPAARFRGFARAASDGEGRYAIVTVKPAAVRDATGALHAPHLAVSLFARGLLKRLVTRIYFADEEAANRADPVLARLGDPAARATLIAVAEHDGRGYRFDLRLQGEGETVFFELE